MNFQSYIIPGAVFFIFGLKWSYDAAGKDGFKCNKTSQQMGKHSSWNRSSNRSPHNKRSKTRFSTFAEWPFEGLVKLTATSIGIAFSVAIAYIHGNSQFTNYILNAMVYLIFGLSGIVDVMIYFCPGECGLPPGADKFILSFAFATEGLMFYLHLSHQSFMEQHIHILLVLAIFSCAFAALSEALFQSSTDLPKFARSLFTMIHGSWYIQSGFLLHNPFESERSAWTSSLDYNIALTQISLKFTAHCVGGIVLLLLIFIVSNGRRRRRPLLISSTHIDSPDSTGSTSSNDTKRCPFTD